MNFRKDRQCDVLLVEDSQSDIDLIRMTLREASERLYLSVVRDGDEAIEFLHRRGKHSDAPRPDLVVLDLNLPKRHGHEVLMEIKASADLKTIPVVIFSSSESSQHITRAYELAANCYVQKPSDLDEFTDAVRGIELFWLERASLPGV